MKSKKSKSKTGKSVTKLEGGKGKIYPFEYRLKAVKLHLEEGYSYQLISEEMGASRDSICKWVKTYREQGEEGLKKKKSLCGNSRRKLASSVKEKIVEMKKENPRFGVKRISQTLKRFFLMGASAETVRATLHEESLIEKPKKKPVRNVSKPRFFERSTPNQLWQSDICMFRLGGGQAYVIGYIDDYSRFIIGLGLYRSQTADHVIESYRCAITEYGVPKEMLTDNGRQYTNWRGTTRFERELQKDKVKHIKSRPHHPMTLGKIERFWKTLFSEFLQRAQFESFEDARDRLSIWVKYYNYKRPHQGIGGLCPADRFFEIQNDLRRVLENGVEENALELALRGKPNNPFYMVGRMGDQSVVIHAEKGKVKMLVDGEEKESEKQLTYNLEENHNGTATETKEVTTREEDVHGDGEMRGGPGGLDGTSDDNGDIEGDGGESRHDRQVAGDGDGSHAELSGIKEESETPSRPECKTGETVREEVRTENQRDESSGTTIGEHSTEEFPEENSDVKEIEAKLKKQLNELPVEILSNLLNSILEGNSTRSDISKGKSDYGEKTDERHLGEASPPQNRTYSESSRREDDRKRSGQTTECLSQNLLSMGEARSRGHDELVAGQRCRPAENFGGETEDRSITGEVEREGRPNRLSGAENRVEGDNR